MRILVFNYEDPPITGGGGLINAQIAEILAASHRIVVITSALQDLPSREQRNGVEIHRVWVPGRRDSQASSLRSLLFYPLSAYATGIRLTRRERFDVINGHFAVPTGPGSVAVARRRRIPHVLSLHGGDLYDPSKSLSPHRVAPIRRTVTGVLRASDAVVAQSTNTKDNVYRYYAYRGSVEVIPLGIRPPDVRPVDRETLRLPKDVFLTVTIGRLVRRKGVDALLRTLSRPECDTVHLVVLGAGPELESLRRLAAELNVAQRIHFTGYVDDRRKWEILLCADAYASATMHEGFGLVYLEAMMAGLPIVTYDHGGQTDFLREGETGHLIPAGDEDRLAEAVAHLVRCPTLAKEIGLHNRSASRAFTVERCARAYEELFERLVSASRGSDASASNAVDRGADAPIDVTPTRG